MRVLATLAILVGAAAAVDQATYDLLKYYYKYASSAYPAVQPCLHPGGQTLVGTFKNTTTGAEGFIARDDIKKAFVIAFAGRTNAADNATIANSSLVIWNNQTAGAHVHKGYKTAYLSVKTRVFTLLNQALAVPAHKNYTIVTTGHDIGGPLAVFAGSTVRSTLFDNLISVFTYGEPRMGDLSWAFFIDETLGYYVRRVTNLNDGVVKTPPLNYTSGYVHHPVEYHMKSSPSTAATTTQCREYGDTVVGEDEHCSIGTTGAPGVNAAHNNYFGIATGTQFCT